jgi:primosomal protein N' (replication factor Y)
MTPLPSSPQDQSPVYADVVLHLPITAIYQYLVPGEMRAALQIGALVRVPLRGRSVNGCIVGLSGEKKCESPKAVEQILSPGFAIEQELIELARWMAEYYFCSFGDALSCVSFIGFNDCRKRFEKWMELIDPAILRNREILKTLTPRQREILDYFQNEDLQRVKTSALHQDLNVSYSVIQGLVKKGIVRISEYPEERSDGYGTPAAPTAPHILNSCQRAAFDRILEKVKSSQYATFLLYGVTGSGKTEIYLQILKEVVDQGRQGIVLVPEIALTPQTVERFRSRFGDRIGVYHSQMSLGQKFDLWHAIREGRIHCLVGPRSAVFAPFPRLGLIVVDEEHEGTYKQNESPRYHARDVAVLRASRSGAAVILGTATPSLESYYNTKIGKFTLLTLPERIRKIPLPAVELIDMGKELIHKQGTGIFSRRLEDAIQKRLEMGEQVILFLNRRGFANFLMCFSCDKPLNCPHCEVTMTYHKVGESLVCHYCGETQPVPNACPYCGHEPLSHLGIGTQRLEEELQSKFPSARILRMDSDSLGSRKAFIQTWKAITNGEVDILFGTQILAKGFDLAPVTLVGVISADHSLFLPDFRSAERTFALLTQVAGRAGRGDKLGEVIIQTYLPNHYSIVHAMSQDYSVFAERELKNRKALRFPPYHKLISVLFAGKNQKMVSERIIRFANLMRVFRNQMRLTDLSVLGPASSPIGRIGDKYRYRLLLRGESIHPMQRLLHATLDKYHSLKLKGPLSITIDVDPLDLL